MRVAWMGVKAMDGETETLQLRDRQVMTGLREVRASALGSADSFRVIGRSWWEGSLLLTPHWL